MTTGSRHTEGRPSRPHLLAGVGAGGAAQDRAAYTPACLLVGRGQVFLALRWGVTILWAMGVTCLRHLSMAATRSPLIQMCASPAGGDPRKGPPCGPSQEREVSPPSQASDSRVSANPQRGQPAELLCPWALRLTQVMAGIVCLLDEQVSGSYRDLKHLDITFVGM